MAQPVWVERIVVDIIHHDQLLQHGGRPGVRDENALESALARPRNKFAYDPDSDLATVAAAYGFGLATGHGYIDGNKRVAFMVMYVFLDLNGWDLDAPEPEVVDTMRGVADGRVSENELADWVRTQMVRRS